MLYDIEFHYFDKRGKETTYVYESGVNLDLWNIRHWRKFYYDLEKEQNKHLTQVKFRPHASFQLLPPKDGL